MRKTLRASVLVLAFAFSARAGVIPCPPVAPPPPTSAPAEEAATEGDITNPPLVVIVLTLLSLF